MDGGVPGELEYECFDAWRAVITFHGSGVHPGYAKNKLINAATIAARFIAALPEAESPEHTERREGFFHVSSIEGSNEKAEVEMIIRDFEEPRNQERIQLLKSLSLLFELRYPGLKVSIETSHQYKNMYRYIKEFPEVIQRARSAIERAGLSVIERPIRGGTDGSVLSERGHPTPNIFAGEMLIHSRREWVGLSSMEKAVEVILHLGNP